MRACGCGVRGGRAVWSADVDRDGGAAASVETLATQAAIDTLKMGGNAVDAAVAAAGVLGVTEPFSCGIYGGGFMIIRTADGRLVTIDGRERADVRGHFEGSKKRPKTALVKRFSAC